MRPLKFLNATILAVVAASPVASSVWAAEPTANARLDESVRCFVVSSMLMTLDDSEINNVGQMSSLYFMGRLDGATSDKDLEDRLFALSQTLDPADIQKDVAHCAEILKVRGAAIQVIGQKVEVRETAAAAAKK